MTVSYQYDVASSTSGGFTRLLFKWKGSLYKLVYREFLFFMLSYSLMSVIYRFAFSKKQKRAFERLAFYCDSFMNYIPLSFILGFYVSFVASRWWQQYMAIPWPDKLLHSIALYVSGSDDKGRMIRRTMVRYLNLSLVMVLRSISSSVKMRFPTVDHIVEAGFMTSAELEYYKNIPCTEYNTYWVPCSWFTTLLSEARAMKRIPDPHGVKLIMEMFLEYRAKCGLLWCYDWVSIPLVYTQVVTIATYAFFFACIIGRQYLEKSPIPYRLKPDLYIPYFTILQFFFYMGLLKVAEQLINPFGDDDEDFEMNWIIDRHMKVSYLIVDTLLSKLPPLTKDMYFDQQRPQLPYTEASMSYIKKAYKGSAADMIVPEDQQTLILPDIEEEDSGDNVEDKRRRSSLAGGLFSSHTGMFSSGSTERDLENDSVSVNMTALLNNYHMNGVSTTESLYSGDRTLPNTPKISAASRYSSRRRSSTGIIGSAVSTGSGGAVSNAVLAVGTDQILLATGSDYLNNITSDETLDYISQPVEPDCTEAKQTFSNKVSSSLKFPKSIKSRIAMRKKPVIKWKPFKRPLPQVTIASPRPLPEGVISVPDGCYEEECAFMWRTIEDEVDPFKTVSSTNESFSNELRENDCNMKLKLPYIDSIPKGFVSKRYAKKSSHEVLSPTLGSRLPKKSRKKVCRRAPKPQCVFISISLESLPTIRKYSKYFNSNVVSKCHSENSIFLTTVNRNSKFPLNSYRTNLITSKKIRRK